MMLWLCVAIRILANPFSNAFQKLLAYQTADPLFIIFATHGLLSLACIPLFFIIPWPLSGEFWFNIAVCSILCVAGNVLIVQALKRSDLSVLGPINAYKSVVSLLPGMLLLHEFPGLLGMSGIALIVFGSYFLVDQQANEAANKAIVRLFRDKGIQLRFAALILSATEAVYLKRALHASSSLTTFAYWSVLGLGVSLVAVGVTLDRTQLRHEAGIFRSNLLTYLLLFGTTGLMQLSTIFVLAGFQVGYALALFQTSTIISVVLGHRLFQEGQFLKRLFGSAIMVAGAILIIAGR
jgi:drug/metabolite transporter (DMT)-like permease